MAEIQSIVREFFLTIPTTVLYLKKQVTLFSNHFTVVVEQSLASLLEIDQAHQGEIHMKVFNGTNASCTHNAQRAFM